MTDNTKLIAEARNLSDYVSEHIPGSRYKPMIDRLTDALEEAERKAMEFEDLFLDADSFARVNSMNMADYLSAVERAEEAERKIAAVGAVTADHLGADGDPRENDGFLEGLTHGSAIKSAQVRRALTTSPEAEAGLWEYGNADEDGEFMYKMDSQEAAERNSTGENRKITPEGVVITSRRVVVRRRPPGPWVLVDLAEQETEDTL
jgi:hypothetical protein